MRQVISTRDLAAAIGVSESSLKRWADNGLIAVSRTAGGHRRIAIGEAIRFIRASTLPLVKPEVLGLEDMAIGGEHLSSPQSPAEQLYQHLHDGRAREVRGLLMSLYLSGQSIARIADGPIRSAMGRLGELWQHDPAGIFIEHRAVDICMQGVQQLRPLIETDAPGDFALGGAPSGDPYLLPTLLASMVLLSEGWRAMNLGPNTPYTSLMAAVERYSPRLVWLSVSYVRDAIALSDGLRAFADAMKTRGIDLVVGGNELDLLDLTGISLRREKTLAELLAKP